MCIYGVWIGGKGYGKQCGAVGSFVVPLTAAMFQLLWSPFSLCRRDRTELCIILTFVWNVFGRFLAVGKKK